MIHNYMINGWQFWSFIIIFKMNGTYTLLKRQTTQKYRLTVIWELSQWKKKNQIKSDRLTSRQWSFRLSCLHLKSWTHISITTAQLEMTNKRFACSQNTSNPAPNLCTSGWQNFIRVFTSLLRAAKKHNLVIYYKASTASEIKLPKPTSSPSFELSVPRFIHTKGYIPITVWHISVL